MSSVRFRTSDTDLELRGSEAFVLRQLSLLAPGLGRVDTSVLDAAIPAPLRQTVVPAPSARAPVEVAAPPEAVPAPAPAAMETVPVEPVRTEPPASGKSDAANTDELVNFYRSFPAVRRDDQAEAALLFAYYLQREEGVSSLRLGDLLRCCARAGVDSRNFHRSLGTLTRRGLIEEVRRGESYRISGQGIATVEEMRG